MSNVTGPLIFGMKFLPFEYPRYLRENPHYSVCENIFHPTGNELGADTEFETKYWVLADQLEEFKAKVSDMSGLKSFHYSEGPDVYWTKEELFFRYRKAAYALDGEKAWLTMKKKPDGALNNIKRIETDVRVDSTPLHTIEQMVTLLGFEHDFEVYKTCHIYCLEDVTLVFYGVRDEHGNRRNFLEIEVQEKLLPYLTEEQAYKVIEYYEAALAMTNVDAAHRINESLFDMYTTTKEKRNG